MLYLPLQPGPDNSFHLVTLMLVLVGKELFAVFTLPLLRLLLLSLLLDHARNASFVLVIVLDLYEDPGLACPHMLRHLFEGLDALAEGALAERLFAFDGLVLDLLLLDDPDTAALTDHLHVETFIQLMSA